MNIKYIKGYPTQKCVQELISSFWGNSVAPRISSYGFNGKLIWDRSSINSRIDDFAAFLNENGAPVKDYRLYDSPSVGMLTFEEKQLLNPTTIKRK